MSKKTDVSKNMLIYSVDPTECPFREFRDSELSPDFWGMGPTAFRMASQVTKGGTKLTTDPVWKDEQTQPLPRSVRQYLHGWIRAEELAVDRWDSEVVVFEDNDGGRISITDFQLSHAQVLLRSSFCRRVLSACFILERAAEGFIVEHQWDNFNFSLGSEGWRAKYHIYSPGMKPGGGLQHRPGLSKNGCYLVRLFYLGAWRCVWVNDQVPVDATDSPLLPFSPLVTHAAVATKPVKQPAPMVTALVVHLWPLLILKAMLKLAAPEMISDEDVYCFDDETLSEFNILHALTGSMNLTFTVEDSEILWGIISEEVTLFSWDDDDETMTNTLKSKSTKKPVNKENEREKRSSLVSIIIEDTKNLPAYALPGITPGHEMSLIVTMARDVPLKRPLPEPDVPLWKQYRWVDWARSHGLYEDYDCPRTRFLKVNGLLKMSYSPHLLDVQSTESIRKIVKDTVKPSTVNEPPPINKEDLREWIQYNAIQSMILSISVLHYPSMYQYTTAASAPSVKIMKIPNRSLDIPAPKSAPLYVQIDGPEENILRISLNVLHPRILMNAGVPVLDYIEPAYVLLEKFEFFEDSEIPLSKSYLETRGYDSMEVNFLPGRHFCRIWVHSRLNWSLSLLSQSTILLGTRDMILSAAVYECPWASRFLSTLGTAFNNWIRVHRSNNNLISLTDREFFSTYQPDLEWDKEIVGYNKALLHWMFRKALESLLMRKMSKLEFTSVCPVLRRHFLDPDFGFPPKPLPPKSLKNIVNDDPCDCVMPEVEETEIIEEQFEIEEVEDKQLVDSVMMEKLLTAPEPPVTSQVCELATEELPCGILKDEREKVIQQHEAATILQAHWRGRWARKCLTDHVVVSSEILKYLMDYAFGNLESLSALMNEFFLMFPSTKYAYSVASALSGVYGIQHHVGISPVTPKCKWIPYFQGVFYCHASVKVHLDVQSSLPHDTLAIYNNDSGKQLPQVYNTHVTFDIHPNVHGYTVMGHGTLNQALGHNSDVHWQLTVLTSIDDVFHICDNEPGCCKTYSLQPNLKLHLDEIFIPNRRNILGGIQISVTKHDAVSFRVAATSPDLKMEALLRTLTVDGDLEVVDRCFGVGELYWPFIRLESLNPITTMLSPVKRRSMSHANLSSMNSARSLKNIKSGKPHSAGNKSRSATRIKDGKAPPESKQYYIQVVATDGWPLNVAQWKRVIEVRNTQVQKTKAETIKKPGKEKPGASKDKDRDRDTSPVAVHLPQPDDAYVELECSYVGYGAIPKRDDERDLEFAAVRRAWDLNDPGRNNRGAQIRHEFRSEFLEALPPPPTESAQSIQEEDLGEEQFGEHETKELSAHQQGPTPATESGLIEMSVETEEEALYLTMPEQLKDKFVPLYFVPLCTKEHIEEESVVITMDKAKAAKNNRHARIDAAIERMNELQSYNENHVLLRQRVRCGLIDKLFIDSQWSSALTEALEERDDAIARETLMRSLSATKKKQEVTKKK